MRFALKVCKNLHYAGRVTHILFSSKIVSHAQGNVFFFGFSTLTSKSSQTLLLTGG